MNKKNSEEIRLSAGVIVIKRKLRQKPKTTQDLLADIKKYQDPSHESEKPRNPLVFQKTSYTKALKAQPLWLDTRVPSNHIHALLGEPTRAQSGYLEWVLKTGSKEIVKIVVSGKGTDIYGFNKTTTLESWVSRFLNS